MVLFNYSTKELTAKIVYYGPGLCGKTTNLEFVYGSLPEDKRGRMLSLSTQTDRTLYFDFLPVELGDIRGMKTRVQLYTVPGQVFYDETRRMVLKGVDGVVFVADSQKAMADANLESFQNLRENLQRHGLDLAEIPLVLQFNKRDLPDIQSVEEMNSALNSYNAPFYEAVATTGIGVHDTLKAISKLVLRSLTQKYDNEQALQDEGCAAMPPMESGEDTQPAVEPAQAADEVAGTQHTPLPETSPEQDTDADHWDCASLEDALDQMNADEIQGLLEEVDELTEEEADQVTEAAAPVSAGADQDHAAREAATDEAWNEPEIPTDVNSGFASFTRPETNDTKADSVWMGTPDDNSEPAIPADHEELESALEKAASQVSAEEQPPQGDALTDPNSAMTFESFMESQTPDLPQNADGTGSAFPSDLEGPAGEAPEFPPHTGNEPHTENTATREDPVSITPTGNEADAPAAATESWAAEDTDTPCLTDAGEQPRLSAGLPDRDDQGALQVPIELDLNGQSYTYILTLSLTPRTEETS